MNSWNQNPMTAEDLIIVLRQLKSVLEDQAFHHVNIVVFGGAEQVRVTIT